MSKFLLIAIAFAAGFWLLRNHRRRADRRADHDARPAPDPQAEDMVACALCGVHLPRGESVIAETRYFCSQEHEQKYRLTR